ncbi:hypothetical protein DXG01_006556 [Tephrocybe rancida]|nr:hypothetical protein DXG01_006556 [Tephrocybe rancida]
MATVVGDPVPAGDDPSVMNVQLPSRNAVSETNLQPATRVLQPKPKGHKPKTFTMNRYKTHAMGDYTATIKKYGTTDSYSTEPGELEHWWPKGNYKRTSKKHFQKQLAQIEWHQARLRRIKAWMDAIVNPADNPTKPGKQNTLGWTTFGSKTLIDPALLDLSIQLMYFEAVTSFLGSHKGSTLKMERVGPPMHKMQRIGNCIASIGAERHKVSGHSKGSTSKTGLLEETPEPLPHDEEDVVNRLQDDIDQGDRYSSSRSANNLSGSDSDSGDDDAASVVLDSQDKNSTDELYDIIDDEDSGSFD